MKTPVKIDIKTLYEILPDLPAREICSTCRRCNKEMKILGEIISISWNDYLDGSGEIIDLCEPCAKVVIEKIKKMCGD